MRLPPPPGEGAHLLSKQHAGIQPGERWQGEAKSQAMRSLNVQGADWVPSRARNQIRPRDPERSRARGAHAALPRAPRFPTLREGERWGSERLQGNPPGCYLDTASIHPTVPSDLPQILRLGVPRSPLPTARRTRSTPTLQPLQSRKTRRPGRRDPGWG